jgi:hypothetical protein
VGRRGTFQAIIREITKKDIFGYYLLTEGSFTQFNPSNAYDAYFGCLTRSLCKNAPDTILYETLFSDTGPTVVSYDDELLPVFDPGSAYDTKSIDLLKPIQAGALNYIRDVLDRFGDDVTELRQEPLESNYLLTNFWASHKDYQVIESLQHEGLYL